MMKTKNLIHKSLIAIAMTAGVNAAAFADDDYNDYGNQYYDYEDQYDGNDDQDA